MNKSTIKKNSLQETLIIPLYARWLCSRKFPGLFQDQTAGELIKKVDYDFSALEKQSESIICVGDTGLSPSTSKSCRH